MPDENKVNKIVDAYLASLYPEQEPDELLEDHETPDTSDVNRMLKRDQAKGITATSRAEISNYVKEALYKKLIMHHKWPSGIPPFGYKIDKNHYLKVKKKNAEIVKWVFNRYLVKKTVGAVAYDLKKEKGIDMQKHNIYYFLKNPIYIGFYHVSGETAYMKDLQIIDERVFMEVQKLMKSGKERNTIPMQSDRKEHEIDRIFNAHLEALNSGELDQEYEADKKFEEEYEPVAVKKKRRVNRDLRSETLRFESQYIVNAEDPRITDVISKLMTVQITNEMLTKIEDVLKKQEA
jgi:hypothetical protein